MTEIKETTINDKKTFINLKGLKIYAIFLLLTGGVFVYLQLNGISLFPDSNTEHEGNQHTYGHHK